MLDTLVRLFQGYARPVQILVLCTLYYALMFALKEINGGDESFSDLGILMMALDWSVGMVLAYAAWNTYKRYTEDPLRMPALLVAWFGSLVFLLMKY